METTPASVVFTAGCSPVVQTVQGRPLALFSSTSAARRVAFGFLLRFNLRRPLGVCQVFLNHVACCYTGGAGKASAQVIYQRSRDFVEIHTPAPAQTSAGSAYGFQ